MTSPSSSFEDRQRALISWLAARCGENGSLGKTAIQKLVYLLTSLKKVDTGYKFSLYTYGPYSKDLQGDLDTADLLKCISLSYIEDQNRYVVQKSTKTQESIIRCQDYIDENIESLEWIAARLGSKPARYLELYSTIHYILQNESPPTEDDAVSRLIDIKPKFNRRETLDCLNEVKAVL